MSSAAEAPQDSVLRRHWEAARSQTGSSSSAASSTANNTSSGSGFFGWLKSLFS